MRQVIADAPGVKAIANGDDGAKRTCGIARRLDMALPARKLMGPLPLQRVASLLIAATVLVGTSASQTLAENAGPRAPVQLAQAPTSDPGTSQGVPERELYRTETMARGLAAARRDLESVLTLLGKARDESTRTGGTSENEDAQQQEALQQERERAGRLEQALAVAQRDVEMQTGLAAKASEEMAREKQAAESASAELKVSLQQERDKAEALTREVSDGRARLLAQEELTRKAAEETAGLRQAAEGTAELRQSLSQERERAGRLEQALAAAQRDLETQTAQAAQAAETIAREKQAAESASAELQKSLQQERDRSVALTQEVSKARAALFAHEAQARKAGEEAAKLKQADGTAQLRQSLSQERERAGRLEQDLAAARSEKVSAEAQARKASEQTAKLRQAAEGTAELRKSLQRERERADRLEQALASAQHDVEMQAALAAKTREETARAKQAAESGSAELEKSLQQARDKGVRLERELTLVRSTKQESTVPPGLTGQPAPDQQREAEAAAALATVGETRGGVQGNPPDTAEVARLMARASVLLGQGDIGSARIVLERAAETGSAQASFALAETYDPLVLPKWKTYGTRGDASKAQTLYAKAEAGGIKEARKRFDALRR